MSAGLNTFVMSLGLGAYQRRAAATAGAILVYTDDDTNDYILVYTDDDTNDYILVGTDGGFE
jgi:hypothetical protein